MGHLRPEVDINSESWALDAALGRLISPNGFTFLPMLGA
jgi:hypothetical protein